MKVLWLTNYALPDIAEKIGAPILNNESWLINTSRQLADTESVKLAVCFPQIVEERVLCGAVNGIEYFGYNRAWNPSEYSKGLKDTFYNIISEFKPDVLHIMGTEFPHCYSLAEACEEYGLCRRIVISIQGLVSVYSEHYYAYMDSELIAKRTLRDIIKKDGLRIQKEKYKERGKYEILTLNKIQHVIGRTEWDKACTFWINPKVTYHYCGETLRSEFYEGSWKYGDCQKHSIFISQATYPIKGFHLLLKAAALLEKHFKDLKIYVASKVPYGESMDNPSWRNSQYVSYICRLIRKFNLKDKIVFLGSLDAKVMRINYLRANVFVSASSIENSPNSVGEALMLGVPIVSSDVGGVKNLISHGEEGFIYPADEPYMLAYYIYTLFTNREVAEAMSVKAQVRAKELYGREKNLHDLIRIYESINLGGGEE